jgi:hypothetical protein
MSTVEDTVGEEDSMHLVLRWVSVCGTSLVEKTLNR